MESLEKLVQSLRLDTKLTTEDIPNLDLYMDQVIQLFEKKYSETKRTPDEKILTKTMINNYSKGKLFFPIKNKKYSPEHVMLINLIYEMKTVLAIRDIQHMLQDLNDAIVSEKFDLNPLYNSFLELSESNLDRFTVDSNEIVEEIANQNADFNEADPTYLNKILLILSFVNMSNYYRRAAEALVDTIKHKEKNKD